MKRLKTTLLALALFLALTMSTAATEDGTAATMRLTQTEGTVAVTNAADRAVTQRKDMRLYSGYTLSTQLESYAYISLDTTKAAKLDASSAAAISRSGKKLAIKATAGKLFFNVPVALEADESMEIRTSNMVTGIRGTAGWVHILDRYTTRVALLEGVLTIHSQDPLTGEDRSVTITGGQIATIIRHEKALEMEEDLIREGVIIEDNIIEELTEPGQIVEELTEDAIPGFVGTEVAKDEDLQDRIRDGSPLDVNQIIEQAADRLWRDETQARSRNRALENEKKQLPTAEPITLFAREPEVKIVEKIVEVPGETVYEKVYETIYETRTETVQLPGETVYVDRPGQTVTITNTVHALPDDPTAEEVNELFTPGQADTVTIGTVSDKLKLYDLKIEENDTLHIFGGMIGIDEDWAQTGTVVLNNTTMTIHPRTIVDINGTLDVASNSLLINDGTLNVLSTTTLSISGTLTNNGELNIGTSGKPGRVVIQTVGKATNTPNGIICVGSEAAPCLDDDGSTTTSALINYGKFSSEGAIHLYETFRNVGDFKNSNPDSTLRYDEIYRDLLYDKTNEAYFSLDDYFFNVDNYISERLRNPTGMMLIYSTGNLCNAGTFTNDGDLFNAGTMIAYSTFTQSSGIFHMIDSTATVQYADAANGITYYGGYLNLFDGVIAPMDEMSYGYALYCLGALERYDAVNEDDDSYFLAFPKFTRTMLYSYYSTNIAGYPGVNYDQYGSIGSWTIDCPYCEEEVWSATNGESVDFFTECGNCAMPVLIPCDKYAVYSRYIDYIYMEEYIEDNDYNGYYQFVCPLSGIERHEEV